MELVYKKSQSHTGNLVSNLKCNGDFCDVTIKCGDFQVMAHKCVLAASTEYFRRMLLTDTHEAKTGIINFSAMLPEVVEQFVDFIYLGSVGLSMATARGLIDAAEMLQLSELSDLCVEILAENIDLENFAEVITMACLYNKSLLNTPIRTFLELNLKAVVNSDDFKSFEYQAVDYCYELMQRASTKIEALKWRGLMMWTNADLEKRETLFHDLFQKINLQCLPSVFVRKFICPANIIDGSMKSLQYIRRFFANKLPIVKERNTSPSHITSINLLTRLVYQYDLRDEEWAVVGELPSASRWLQSVAEYDGILYLGDGVSLHSFSEVGWKLLHQIEEEQLPYDIYYSRVVCTGRWVIMITACRTVIFEISTGDINEVRHHTLEEFTDGFFVLGLDATVYVLGGVERTVAAGERKTVAKLKLVERRYVSVASMAKGRAYGAAIQYNAYMYAIGGHSRTVEFHNTRTRQWQILGGREIQCRNLTAHLADKLYIFGGALGPHVKSVELSRLEITAKDLRLTRRSDGDMDTCCASFSKYIKL